MVEKVEEIQAVGMSYCCSSTWVDGWVGGWEDVPMDEVILEADHIVLVILVLDFQLLEELHLGLGLEHERFAVVGRWVGGWVGG